MKKTLLTLGLLSFGWGMQAQMLMTENFNDLNIGNVSTNFDGSAPGQGGWYVSAGNGAAPTTTNNASANNVKIVADGNNQTKGLALTSPNGDKGATITLKTGFPALWSGRTNGNDIIEVEVDVNTGTRAGACNTGFEIWNEEQNRLIAGLVLNTGTGEMGIRAYATVVNESGTPVTGNYIFGVPGIAFPENQWVRIGLAFNQTTGEIRASFQGLPEALSITTGISAGMAPGFVYLTSRATAANNAAHTFRYDNLTIRATETENLLSTPSFNDIDVNLISVYPNPAQDIINVGVGENMTVNAVSITDVNGRVIRTEKMNAVSTAQINIADLSAGMYFLTIDTNQGSGTKKFFKN